MSKPQKLLILGIGNVLWADEGFGVRAVEALHRGFHFPANVTLLDGGTQGLNLIHYVCDADVLVVLDAVDYGLPAGSLKCLENAEVPKFLGARKMSLHQTGFQEVLAMAELLGKPPAEILLVGVQPVELEDYGGSLRPEVKRQIPVAIEAVLDYLARRGIQAIARNAPLPEQERLNHAELEMAAYEAGRPSERAACRFGDARVLAARVPDPKNDPAEAVTAREIR